jgi:hypothetical protein
MATTRGVAGTCPCSRLGSLAPCRYRQATASIFHRDKTKRSNGPKRRGIFSRTRPRGKAAKRVPDPRKAPAPGARRTARTRHAPHAIALDPWQGRRRGDDRARLSGMSPAFPHFSRVSPERRGFLVCGPGCISPAFLRLRSALLATHEGGGGTGPAWSPGPYHANASRAGKCAMLGERKEGRHGSEKDRHGEGTDRHGVGPYRRRGRRWRPLAG